MKQAKKTTKKLTSKNPQIRNKQAAVATLTVNAMTLTVLVWSMNPFNCTRYETTKFVGKVQEINTELANILTKLFLKFHKQDGNERKYILVSHFV